MNNDLDRRVLLGAAGFAGLAAVAAGRAGAGPLAPPAGAVASSGKTLSDVEPRVAINATNTPGNATSVYRITQGGSYYLTGNVVFPTGKSAIEISASNVVIDLNGYVLSALGGVSGVKAVSDTVARTVIRNGTIWNGSGPGIDFAANDSVTVENVAIESTDGPAIAIGNNGRVSGCTVVGCSTTGGEIAVKVSRAGI
ncbi:MAG TPA: right-handed parallel beta-helix repeat-containing protein, partial [Phycisphaerales bacterium]|nr:right-handed parallel beta-helix repeat-containing protein [Phycisphaerales bacterium]